MYKVLAFDSEKAGDKLNHGDDVFHEALRKKLEYCHVYKDDQPLYDLQKIDNNCTKSLARWLFYTESLRRRFF